MDAGWSVMCDWISARAAISISRPQVFSLHSIVGTFLRRVVPRNSLSVAREITEGKCEAFSISRASAMVWTALWGADDMKSNSVSALLILAAAVCPPLILPQPSAAFTIKAPVTEIKVESDRVSQDHTKMMVEPQSGAQFPLYLFDLQENALHFQASQVLGGVGVRCKQLMKIKSVNLYAFGMYVHPESLRTQLGKKYAGVSPNDLKLRSDFYDDLLRHEVNLTVRLVVLYKGLTADLVRRAFQVSLKNRLRKMEGVEDDEGLRVFCSYLSGNIEIRKGTVIDIHWQPGGRLHTIVDGHRVGTIFSKSLCRAFFDLYIGDPPVSHSAKQSIGENFAKLLNGSVESENFAHRNSGL